MVVFGQGDAMVIKRLLRIMELRRGTHESQIESY
jgi:hypothetical protein